MSVHVAEASEGRGRVILRFSAWQPNDCAIDAAMTVARAFQSEVETLFIEDAQRINFARFPFAREFSLRDGAMRPVSARSVQAEFRGAFAAARKRVAAAAARAEVRYYENEVRDEPVHALVAACAQRGPWNVIAIAETFGSPAPCSLDEMFDTVTDATGVIVAGPQAKPGSGPIVIAIEDTARLDAMLRSGRRLAEALETDIIVLLVAGEPNDLERMDGEVRLVLGGQKGIRIAQAAATYGERNAIADVIRRIDGGFLIAEYGGILIPRAKTLRPLTGVLNCPLLLVR